MGVKIKKMAETLQVLKYHNYVNELIDSLLKDESDHLGPVAFIDLLARTGEVSKVIEALALEVGTLESFEAKAAVENVKLFWNKVEKELAQIDAADCCLEEIFSKKSPEARKAMEDAKAELKRVRLEIEKIVGNAEDVEITPVDVSFKFQ